MFANARIHLKVSFFDFRKKGTITKLQTYLQDKINETKTREYKFKNTQFISDLPYLCHTLDTA